VSRGFFIIVPVEVRDDFEGLQVYVVASERSTFETIRPVDGLFG